MGNGNSSTSKSKVRAQRAKVASTEAQHVPRQGKPSTKAEVVGSPTDEGHGTKPKVETPAPLKGQHQHGDGVLHSEQRGNCKTSLDNDDTFIEFIRRAKYKIRSLSNIGQEQSDPTPAPASNVAYNGTTNNKENQKDQFADFIQLAKKKLRTTSRNIGKNSSFRGG